MSINSELPIRLPDNTRGNLRGLAYLAMTFLLFSTADTLAKFLTGTMPPLQIAWMRQSGLAVTALILLLVKGPGLLRSARPRMQLSRGMIAVLSPVLFISAVRYVPLADAVAVTLVAPLLVTVMGAIFLRERVSAGRWVAIAVGFVGALIIIRPGLGVFHPAIFLVIAAAAFFALRQVLSRPLSRTDNILTTLCYTALTGYALLSLLMPFVWQWPSPRDFALGLAIAGLAATGEVLVIKTFEVAEAVVVAPIHYSAMIWATFYGWLIFGQLPDIWTWLGTAIILATGLYLVGLERRAMRAARLAGAGRQVMPRRPKASRTGRS